MISSRFEEMETIEHDLFLCEWTVEVWEKSGLKSDQDEYWNRSNLSLRYKTPPPTYVPCQFRNLCAMETI